MRDIVYMITQEERNQQSTQHVCFCELCMPVIDSLPITRESQEETVPEQKPETVVALAA
jgi:hypothetical protein